MQGQGHRNDDGIIGPNDNDDEDDDSRQHGPSYPSAKKDSTEQQTEEENDPAGHDHTRIRQIIVGTQPNKEGQGGAIGDATTEDLHRPDPSMGVEAIVPTARRGLHAATPPGRAGRRAVVLRLVLRRSEGQLPPAVLRLQGLEVGPIVRAFHAHDSGLEAFPPRRGGALGIPREEARRALEGGRDHGGSVRRFGRDRWWWWWRGESGGSLPRLCR
mmetsp:Transcript_36071/g.87076  ORF Transcript_36071/g.87076 Transcript_36071/m.87076 type:complete len:215 (-) Transcript_36071:1489-2133(-)